MPTGDPLPHASSASTRIWCLLHGEKGPALQGNLLLDRLMGAHVSIVDITSMEELQPLLDAEAEKLRSAGREPYVIEPLGLDNLALGALGYVGAAIELDEQLEAACVRPSRIYLAGANMTPAGLALGMKALGRETRLVNIAPIQWSMPRDQDICRIANATAERLGIDTRLELSDIESTDAYIGERYGLVTEGGREAMKLAASTEALILDPVYSAKAMACLVDHARKSLMGRGESVVFVHTGGMPALFAYAEDLAIA